MFLLLASLLAFAEEAHGHAPSLSMERHHGFSGLSRGHGIDSHGFRHPLGLSPDVGHMNCWGRPPFSNGYYGIRIGHGTVPRNLGQFWDLPFLANGAYGTCSVLYPTKH